MIEPFEFETIRLQAPLPSGSTGKTVLHGKGSVDEQEIQSFSVLKQSEDALRLDGQQIRVYQTKIGNPQSIDPHQANLVPERIVSLGPLAVNYEEANASMEHTKTTSELLSTFLDSEMLFVPNTDMHHAPPFSVNAPDTPFLNPGLTSIDSRKLSIHWMK
jgi:hypothetical protein